MYDYRCSLIRVVDADTLWLDVDLGCDTHLRLSIRLHGLNAPERGTVQGADATRYTSAWLADSRRLGLRTIKDTKEKFGRYLGVVYDPEQPTAPTLNEALLAAGHAVPYNP